MLVKYSHSSLLNLKNPGSVQNIVGGSEAVPHSYPWMAAILVKNTDLLNCAGSLIEGENKVNYYILTAAHCVSKITKRDIRLGDHNLLVNEGTEQTTGIKHIKQVIVHPGYDPVTYENDIALLRIPKWKVTLTDQVQVGRLSTSDVNEDDYLTVIGWGRLVEGGSTSPTLQEVVVRVQSDQTCATAYSSHGYYPDSMFCAGPLAGGQDACQADSGGPIMINRGLGWEIAGIVSWGIGCARPGFPGVYADVYSARDWINSVIN